MPTFDPAQATPDATYAVMTGLIVPRPIAWVGTVNTDGGHNLAPHSFYNMVSFDPPVLHFTSIGDKDTIRNIRATPEFTVSVVSTDLLAAMNATAIDAPPTVDEFDFANLTKATGANGDVPWVAEAPAAFACTLRTILAVGNGQMVFGDITAIHIRDGLLVDGAVDPIGLAPLGRLSGSNYLGVGGDVIELARPRWGDPTS